ncbi:hypothetical protein LCM08_04000 [Salipiger pacificus]|nr:hypothetical protein [Alloyangia pacifica]
MTNEKQAPERIWLHHADQITVDGQPCRAYTSPAPVNFQDSQTEYVRADAADAMVAAAYEDAAGLARRYVYRNDDSPEHAIRMQSPANARAALDEAKHKAWLAGAEAERKAIFDRITENLEKWPCDGINAQGEFSDAVKASQEAYARGMRSARISASRSASMHRLASRAEEEAA